MSTTKNSKFVLFVIAGLLIVAISFLLSWSYRLPQQPTILRTSAVTSPQSPKFDSGAKKYEQAMDAFEAQLNAKEDRFFSDLVDSYAKLSDEAIGEIKTAHKVKMDISQNVATDPEKIALEVEKLKVSREVFKRFNIPEKYDIDAMIADRLVKLERYEEAQVIINDNYQHVYQASYLWLAYQFLNTQGDICNAKGEFGKALDIFTKNCQIAKRLGGGELSIRPLLGLALASNKVNLKEVALYLVQETDKMAANYPNIDNETKRKMATLKAQFEAEQDNNLKSQESALMK